MTKAKAHGTFDVKLDPRTEDSESEGPFSRLAITKELRGDLEGTSRGQMLAARTAVEGSAAYVALEHVTGTLHGRRGGFVLQHRGVMQGEDQRLEVTVVPDSGTGELSGLTGSMTITIERGRHLYAMEYELPGPDHVEP